MAYRSHGIKCNKLHDGEVIKAFKRSDREGLIETHADQSISLHLGILFLEKIGLSIKRHGGIAVLIKESIRNMFKFDPMSDSGIIWVRFQKCYTKVLCAFAYLPPSNSTYGKVHGQAIMQKLEKK